MYYALRRQSVLISKPIGLGTYFGTQRPSARQILEVSRGTVENARHDSRGRVDVAPVANCVVTFLHASIGGIVNVERDHYCCSLSHIRTNGHTGHVCIELVVLGS